MTKPDTTPPAPSGAARADMRAAFEAWIRTQYAPNAQHTAVMRHGDQYKRDDVQNRWEGWKAHVALASTMPAGLYEVLHLAESALADIGDADREPGDDVSWCEARAAQALPAVRGMLKCLAALASREASPAPLTDEQIEDEWARIRRTDDSWESLPHRRLARWAFAKGSTVALASPQVAPALTTKQVASVFGAAIGGATPTETSASRVKARRAMAAAKTEVLLEAIQSINEKARETPAWARGYHSAITTIELQIAAIKRNA